MGPKKILIRKIFGSAKILGPQKNSGSKNFLGFQGNLSLIKFDGKVEKNADFSQKLVIFYVSMHIHNYNNIKNEVYFIFK